MVRTSLYLPPTLLYRLQLASKQERRSVSALVVDLVDKALSAREQARLDHMYAELKKLEGAGPKGITNASTTINEALYGEKGAWRAQHGQD